MFIKIHRVLRFARYIVRFNEPGPITAAPRPRPPCAAAPPLSGRSTPDMRYAGPMASADGPDATGTDAAGPDAAGPQAGGAPPARPRVHSAPHPPPLHRAGPEQV